MEDSGIPGEHAKQKGQQEDSLPHFQLISFGSVADSIIFSKETITVSSKSLAQEPIFQKYSVCNLEPLSLKQPTKQTK